MATAKFSSAGLELTEGYADHLARLAEVSKEVTLPGVFGTRQRYDILGERFVYPRPEGMRVRNTFVCLPGREIPVRCYWPRVEGTPPVILYMHGGGFVAGGVDSHDYIVAQLAEATGAAIVSVHYRRGPENKYPAMHEDCYEALLWTVENAGVLGWDATRLAVAGDSAGGLLSTAICMMANDRGGPKISYQALIYGAFSDRKGRKGHEAAKDTTLTVDSLKELGAAYIDPMPDGHTDKLAIPMHATDEELAALPPAYFLNAEYDVLLEEEQEYAARLEDLGVPVTVDTVPGTMHGLLRAMDLAPACRAALDRMAAKIAQALA